MFFPWTTRPEHMSTVFLIVCSRKQSSSYMYTLVIDTEIDQSCPTLCDPIDWGLPGSSVHRILQARILEWVEISFSRGSSRPRDQTGSPALETEVSELPRKPSCIHYQFLNLCCYSFCNLCLVKTVTTLKHQVSSTLTVDNNNVFGEQLIKRNKSLKPSKNFISYVKLCLRGNLGNSLASSVLLAELPLQGAQVVRALGSCMLPCATKKKKRDFAIGMHSIHSNNKCLSVLQYKTVPSKPLEAQAVKKSAYNAGDLGSTPELGRSPRGGHDNPLQYSCLENPHRHRSLADYSSWGVKESDRSR